SAHRPGYDFIFQGMGGLMSITGERDGEPGGGPQKVGIAVTDVLAGMYASLAVTAAIAHRERTGVGQYIDLALFDAVVAFGANQILNYFTSGKIPGRYGNAHANVVPYEVFATADGHLILAVGNDSQFASFCRGCAAKSSISSRRKKSSSPVSGLSTKSVHSLCIPCRVSARVLRETECSDGLLKSCARFSQTVA